MSQLEAGGDGLVTGITFIMRPRNKFTSLFNINNTAEPSWAWTEKSSGPCLKCISRMLTTSKSHASGSLFICSIILLKFEHRIQLISEVREHASDILEDVTCRSEIGKSWRTFLELETMDAGWCIRNKDQNGRSLNRS